MNPPKIVTPTMTVTPAHEIPLGIRRKAIAVHEAGHALVAILLKRDVTEALLRPPDGLSGETRFAHGESAPLDLSQEADRRRAADAIVVLMAGQVAEAEYWRRHASLYSPKVNSHRSDAAEVLTLKSGLALGPEQDALFTGYCIEKAKKLVLEDAAQAAIQEIAMRLSETMSILRTEMDEIITRHRVELRQPSRAHRY
ncbi:hypothetical protein [Xanthobacter aminoxidans]|uniref:ATP-dependent Zn protease n=1 Tax=Xanthobacter aminoxidans TaxID=186280 RepID=A0ABW6ZD37_9HYPH